MYKVMADCVQFHEMGLDDRLLKAIAKLGWTHPTLIQVSMQPFQPEADRSSEAGKREGVGRSMISSLCASVVGESHSPGYGGKGYSSKGQDWIRKNSRVSLL